MNGTAGLFSHHLTHVNGRLVSSKISMFGDLMLSYQRSNHENHKNQGLDVPKTKLFHTETRILRKYF